MTIAFTKMHGLGNDFMVIDAVTQAVTLSAAQIKAWGDRHTGIGFDQCLLIEKSTLPAIDFIYRIFNADGSEVGQCGNGARCLARFVRRQGLSSKKNLRIQTATTVMQLMLHDDDTVTVDFGIPRALPSDIPMTMTPQRIWYEVAGYQCHAINVGNPHAVLFVADITQADVNTIGAQISQDPCFPEQANIGFIQILNPRYIALRVYERGSGETQACGSGAVAAAALGILYHQLERELTIRLPGGELHVAWPDPAGPIYLRGPASFVYDGRVEADACESSS